MKMASFSAFLGVTCEDSVVLKASSTCTNEPMGNCDALRAVAAVPNILQLPRLKVARLSLRSTDLGKIT